MTKFLKLYLISLFLQNILWAQFGPDNIVSVKPYLSKDKVEAGSEVKLGLEISVDPPYHINSNRPKDEFLIPTSFVVKSNEKISITKRFFPPSKDYNFDFSESPVAVFEGTFYAGGMLKVPENLASGTYNLLIELEYQACDDQSCLPPKTISTNINVNVVAKGSVVNEINPAVFSKIALQYAPKEEEKKTEEDTSAAESKIDKNEIVKIDLLFNTEKLIAGEQNKIALKFDIAEKWHINSNKPKDEFLIPTELSVSSQEGLILSSIYYPKDKEYKFEFSEEMVNVYEGTGCISAYLYIPTELLPGKYSMEVVLDYQACNEKSCLAPTTVIKVIEFEITSEKNPKIINQQVFANLKFDQIADDEEELSNLLESSGLLLSLLLVFIGGLALNLTPCVYPLIPITIGYFGGQSEGSTGRLALMGFFYVIGIAITYSIIGVVTALSGGILGALLQEWYVLVFIALIFIVLSLSMFGVYEFKVPDSWMMAAGGSKSGLFGAFFMGLTMGIVAAPCIGPFVIGLVTFVAAKGDVFTGFMLFFFLALGLGLPYFLLAIFSGKIKSLPRSGMWMEAVKHIFGFVLLGMAVYFVSPLLPKPVSTYILPVFIIITGIILLFFDKTANENKGFRYFKSIFAVVLLIIGGYFAITSLIDESQGKIGIEFAMYSDEVYTGALEKNQKVIIDFYADWCIPCKELDAITFVDKDVIAESENFVNLKADLTKPGSDAVKKLTKDFNIKGVPTVIFIDSNGNEVKRITGFVPAKEFLEIMKSVK